MLGKYPGMPALFTYGITKNKRWDSGTTNEQKAGQYQNKTNTSNKKEYADKDKGCRTKTSWPRST